MQLLKKNGLNAKGNQITKVRYTVAIKKDGIIIGYLPQKISLVCRIAFVILTSQIGLASLVILSFLNSSCILQFTKAIMHDKMERDNGSGIHSLR